MTHLEYQHIAELVSKNLIPAVQDTINKGYANFYYNIDQANNVEINGYYIIFKGKYRHIVGGTEEEEEFEKERLEEVGINQWSEHRSNHLIFNYENILPFATALMTYLKEFEAYRKRIRDVITFAEGIGAPATKFVIIEKFKNDFTTA